MARHLGEDGIDPGREKRFSKTVKYREGFAGNASRRALIVPSAHILAG